MLQGTVARECFVIERGTVAVTADGHEVATAGPGSFLGEDTLLHGLVRTETAIATVPVDLIVFDAREFTTLLETVPVLAERLRGPLPSGLNEAAARAAEVRRSSPVVAGA
jgi:CRP-like cAMP-binding protein